jgi:hypothetical protein
VYQRTYWLRAEARQERLVMLLKLLIAKHFRLA